MYIPQNKIITNLYTSGGEYSNKITKIGYIGYYWKDYQGKFYEGKNPNSSTITQELIPLPLLPTNSSPNQLTTNTFSRTNSLYISTRPGESTSPKSIPTPTYPQPTEDDYSLGVFTRYFTVKHNQSTYLEINKDTFDSLNSQKKDWYWQLYFPFSIPWTLIGEKKVVNQINKNIVFLQEKRNKKLGLREFLRFNYLKYYRPDSGEDLYTNGGDYLNKRTGKEYVGYYHIHPTKGPMVGQFHVESDHDYLIPITGNTSGSISNSPITPPPSPNSGYSPSSGGGGGGY